MTSAARTVFLVNPASAGGRTGRRWPELARRAAAAGLSGETLLSGRPGHLTELARQAVAEGARLVVAVGGDGTLNEVANGVAGAEGVEVALLPQGSGSDVARMFRIPAQIDAAAEVAARGRARELDLGRAEYAGGSSWFVNAASAGMTGAVARRANASSFRLGPKVGYAAATLAVFARWRPVEAAVSVDGARREGPITAVVVANCRYVGGGMKICPDAEPDDGLFDVLVIGDASRRELALTMPKVYAGRHLPHPKAELLRGAVVEVEAPAPLLVELDGEQPGTTPARFELVPRALRLRVPT